LPRVIPVVYIHVHYSIYDYISLYLKAISCIPMRTCASMHAFPYTHGLWTHGTRPISFSLVVDDFRVKYIRREHAEHLMTCIKKNYNISSDCNGTAYCGLTLDWDYKNHTVKLSMHGYMKAALHKYQHPAPARPERAPHTWNPPIYGCQKITTAYRHITILRKGR
jgi:hypothetical protein